MTAAPILYRLSADVFDPPLEDLSKQRPHVPKTARCLVARSPKPFTFSSGLLSRALASGGATAAAADGRLPDPEEFDLPSEWWLPDIDTGRRVVIHTLSSTPLAGKRIVSQLLPSGHRIGCITELGESMLVSDSHGNVVMSHGSHEENGGDEAVAKRRRTEGPRSFSWMPVVSSDAVTAQPGALPPMGAGGWTGLLAHREVAVIAREHYKDIRIADVSSGKVMATLFPTHGPTSICWTGAEGVGKLLTVADGPVISTFDARTRGDGIANRVTMRQGTLVWSVAALGSSAPFSLAASDSARSVTIYDVRKWTVVHSVSSVLKHACVGLTPADSTGSHLACTGMDSEFRIVSSAKTDAASSAPAPDDEDLPATASTFRTRIDTTMHCRSAWFGDWAPVLPPTNSNKSASCVLAGVSSTNEVFVALKVAAAP